LAKTKEKIIKDTSERWLLTYADLMNLLLIFFIILYALGQTDQQKFNELREALSNVMGVSSGGGRNIVLNAGTSMIELPYNIPSTVIKSKLEGEQMEEVKKRVEELASKDENLKGNIEVSIQERGVLITIKAQLLFKSGRADIEPASRATVEGIGKEILLNLPGKQIRIEGHTDNVPLKDQNRFKDNWELSTARAREVLLILVGSSVGIDPKMISATGYGEYKPVASNENDEGRTKNRRVDIVILRDIYSVAETGTAVSQEEDKSSAGESSAAPTAAPNEESAATGSH